MPPASPRARVARRVALGATATLAAAAAVPAVQGALMAWTKRPDIPGPHQLDGLVPAPGCTDPLTLVWLGDSLAAGVGASAPDLAFPRRAAALFGSTHGRGVHLTCLAREGARTVDVLAEQVPRAVELLGPGAVAVVTVGSNDVGTLAHPRGFTRRYDAILAALAATGATVVAVGLPDIGSAVVIRQPLRTIARWVGQDADRRIARLADRHGAHVVRIDNRANGAPAHTYLAADRYHPNDDTYHLWAGQVAALLTLAIGRRT